MDTRKTLRFIFTLCLILIGTRTTQGIAAAPNIEYDGIYRSIEIPFNGSWIYLRFFEDGTALFVPFADSIEDLKNWYQPGGSGDAHLTIPAAKFTITGDQFSFLQSYGEDGLDNVDVVGEIKGNYLYTISKRQGQNESYQTKFEFLPVYRKPDTSPTTAQICSVQEYLLRLGFDPGPVDGILGKKTRIALDSYVKTTAVNSVESDFKSLLNSLSGNFHNMEVTELGKSTLGLSRPDNGQIVDRPKKRAIAPLEISTSANRDFFIKLQDHDTGEDITSIYIRANSSSTMKVPLGNLLVKYATGTEWFSRNCLFGLATSLHQAEEVFEFSVEGNQVSGYKIELIIQEEGNLATRRLTGSDW